VSSVASRYLSIRYTERLAEAGAVTSVESRGDSYDNALAESTIGLYKNRVVRRQGPWRGLDDLELATLEWVDWYNHRRLDSARAHRPPAEYEADYARTQTTLTTTRATAQPPLNPGCSYRSSSRVEGRKVRDEGVVDLAGQVTLHTTHDLRLGQALFGAPLGIAAGA
jgi:hypothetical protein